MSRDFVRSVGDAPVSASASAQAEMINPVCLPKSTSHYAFLLRTRVGSLVSIFSVLRSDVTLSFLVQSRKKLPSI